MSKKYTLIIDNDEEFNLLQIAMDHLVEHLIDVTSFGEFYNEYTEDLINAAAIRERLRHV